MAELGRVHDRAILDVLDAIDPQPIADEAWRVTRKGRDPLRGSSAHGRWSPVGEFEVLYTSLQREGALAEIGYRLSLEPVWPSLIEHEIHTVRVETERTLSLVDFSILEKLGVDVAKYQSFDYRATQAIAAAARFLEFDALLVPNARAPGTNLVVFPDRLSEACSLSLQETTAVDWAAWRGNRTRV